MARKSIWMRCVLGTCLLAAPLGAQPAAPRLEVKPILDLRLRWESLDTPSARLDRDATYDFSHLRLRAGGELRWANGVTLRGLLQGTALETLPNAGAFGAGPVYFGTNQDTEPDQVGLAELSLGFKGKRGQFTLGRQGFTEGFEKPTGVGHLDWVKRRRLAERLVGNLDFTAVGRRYDGVSGHVNAGKGQLNAFALRPLIGSFRFEDAFDQLDDVSVGGLTWTTGFGQWLKQSEIRVFALRYDDGRAVARATTGGDLTIDTVGASLLAGNADNDLLLWFAHQQGDWGATDHGASAVVFEVGHRFAKTRGTPSVHLGAEWASGDGRGGDHGAFFNILPTNHKFYGATDYSAFSNLQDLFVELRWSPTEKLRVLAAIHDFALATRDDAWYGGSGAFSVRELGYQARRPAGGFKNRDLGQELDFEVSWIGPRKLELRAAVGLFRGGDAAAEVLPLEEDGRWANVELNWSW